MRFKKSDLKAYFEDFNTPIIKITPLIIIIKFLFFLIIYFNKFNIYYNNLKSLL